MGICVSRRLALALDPGPNLYLPAPALNLCLPVLRFTVFTVVYLYKLRDYLYVLIS